MFSVSTKAIYAQGKPATSPALIPPSPNAAALGDYGKVPVGLFTGTVEQNIPLYTIKTGDYSLPISLNYRSNGTRVSDLGSNVGLGWVLNAGGVITRTLNDKVDEYGSTRLVLPQPVDMNSPSMKTFLLQATSGDNVSDAGPDIFSFNFGRYSGRFYLTGDPVAKDMQAVLIEPSPLKIEFLSDFYSNLVNSVQIRITDPDGIVYVFGGTNAIEKTFSRTYNSGNTAESFTSPTIKSSWYLTNITLLNGEEINFSYTQAGGVAGVVYEAGISQEANSSLFFSPNGIMDYEKAWHPNPKISLVTTAGYKLSEINWRNGKITLDYSARFTGGTTNLEKINTLKIYTRTASRTDLNKQYGFEYLTADAAPAYNNPKTNGSFLENSKRLFLTDLVSLSPTGTELNRYRFDYFNTAELPNRFSYAQDYWGYFNGRGTNTDLVTNDLSKYNSDNYPNSPFTADHIRLAFSDAGGNKEADPVYSQKGMLQKITYPTGGYSSLNYEPHSISRTIFTPPSFKEDVELINGGSTSYTTPIIKFDQDRVQLIPRIDGCPHQNPSGTVSFDLYITDVQSGTSVPVTPSYSSQPEATPITIPIGTQASFYVDLKKGKSYSFQILIHSSCTSYLAKLAFSYYSVDGTYSSVSDIIGGVRLSKVTTGDLTGNETIKKYHYVKDYINASTASSGLARLVEPAVSFYQELGGSNSVLRMTLSSNPLHDLYDAQGYHITYSTVTESEGNNSEGGITVHNFNSVTEIPPFAYVDPVIGTPYSNVFGNGEEIKTSFYKKDLNQFTRVKEITNTYSTDNRLSSSLTCFKAARRAIINLTESCNLSTYVLNSQWRYLASTSETIFDASGGNGSVVKTNYVYDNIVHMQPTAFSTEFEKFGVYTHSLITMNHYPNDFNLTGSLSGNASIIKALADRHIYTAPIEQIKFVFNVANVGSVDSKLSTYKMNGNFIVKDKDYVGKFNNSTMYNELMWITPASINSSGQFVYDPHYEQFASYNVYDISNNLLEVTDRENTSSYIREPNTGEVWAAVKNGFYGDVAYTSFDHSTSLSPNFTNWNYNLSKITAGTSFNGTKSYNLNGAGPLTPRYPLSVNQRYKLSFWRRVSSGTALTLTVGGTVITPRLGPQRNSWQYVEYIIPGSTSIQLSGTYTIDELRLCPINARMKSYVFKDGVGVIGENNENNQQLSYEYDEFNRLTLTRDQDRNILKKNEYKFQYIQN